MARTARAYGLRIATVVPRQRRRTVGYRRAAVGWLYAAPTAIIVAVLFLAPLVLMVWMSLNNWPLIGGHSLNAPDNYRALADNQLARQAVVFTLKYTAIVTVVLTLIGLALALLMQERRVGTAFFRTSIFLPSAIGLATAALLFLDLFSPQVSPINPLLRHLGLIHSDIDFLGTSSHALFSSVALIVWRFAGFNMLLLLVGLNSIPTQLYEAARVDGASPWRVFRSITLPLLRPTFALLLILSITGSLLAFDQFYILTRGGPSDSTVSIVMVIYREAFTRFNLGTAAALSSIVLVALLGLNALQFRVLRGSDSESPR